MKKYAIILFFLIVIGIALIVRFLTQDERLDQTVFIQTTESIRNLQALDKNFSLLLSQSRFNSDFDHESLSDTNYQISEEFDNLRFDALFEEIEASPDLSNAVAEFEKQFLSREETLESYIEGNTEISESLAKITAISESLQQQDLQDSKLAVESILAQNNAKIYRLALGGDLGPLNDHREQLEKIANLQFATSQNIAQQLSEYKTATNMLLVAHQPTKEYFTSLQAIKTAPLLDAIENEYTSFHNLAIRGSNQLRNALILYGICLLGALIYFAIRIRQNYTSLEQEVAERTEEIKTAYDDLQESQEQLIQSEKMASLGQMVAGVAHEINTPLGYVTSNIDTLKLNLADISDVMKDLEEVNNAINAPHRDNKLVTQELVKTIKRYRETDAADVVNESNQLLSDGVYGLSEISKLVTSLKDFARLDRQSTEKIDIHRGLENSLTIASNHIRDNNVKVERNFASELPKIDCYPSKLNQLFLNIITNACQAMSDNGGQLTITTALEDDQIIMRFRDEGVGMSEETVSKMFDPFFTMKEIGEGTGLGMSIAYKIIKAHRGSIDVQSVLGKGTEVKVSLPTA